MGKHAKAEKKGKLSKKDHKARKERRRSASSSASRQSPLRPDAVCYYRGKPCTLLALSYETDPPHAVVRTADGREVGVEMDQLSRAPQLRKKSKKRRRDRGEAKEAAVVTIEGSSQSTSPDRDQAADGVGGSGALTAPASSGPTEPPSAPLGGGIAAQASPREQVAEASGGAGSGAPTAPAPSAPAELPAAPSGEETAAKSSPQEESVQTKEPPIEVPTTGGREEEMAEKRDRAKEPLVEARTTRERKEEAAEKRTRAKEAGAPQRERSPKAKRPCSDVSRRGDDKPPAEAAPAVGPGTASARRLAESVLYREDALQYGHSEVWGSWFDMASQRWGYRCCRGMLRDEPCSSEQSHASEPKPIGASEGPGGPTGADNPAGSMGPGVEGLQPREQFAEAVDFVVHWVRAVLHDWRDALRRGVPEVAAHERFGTWERLGEAERAVVPLLRLLEACSMGFSLNEAVQVWSVGNNKWMNGTVLEVLSSEAVVSTGRTSSNGSLMPAGSVLVSFSGGDSRKWVSAPSASTVLRKPSRVSLAKQAIEKLESIATLSTEREYHAANQAYIELTLGHGRWHGDLSISGLTGSNKAPRNGFKVKRDQSNFLDTEEAKVYMFCLKRLVSFLQLIRPNSDVSKHCT
mmetsp:Transcript_89697/g.280734  ORF Transcript_89697/g.280734 Transcript_89697/m.280734 type:complete len:634 (-) Transcript_89697:190-2091(-)